MRSSLQNSQKLTITDGTAAYRKLRQIVEKQGILDRDYGYYTLLTLFAFSGFFYSAYNIVITPTSLQLLLWCVLFAFFTIQIGGILHDAGHKAIFNSTKYNNILGTLCGIFITMSYNEWNFTHNKHHAHTNQEDEDPDLELPLHAFTKRQFLRQKGIWKMLRRHQAYIFYPLRILTVFTRRWDDVKYFMREKRIGVLWEVPFWIIGISILYIVPFFLFDVTKAIFVLFFVNLATGFYMSNIFAPNHKGMPQPPKDIKISFLEHQVITSRNISGHWLTDFIYLGLNYQIEHHLFPNCPRNKLKRITPHVLAICKEMHLAYTQVSILESNRIILAELQKIAQLPDENKS